MSRGLRSRALYFPAKEAALRSANRGPLVGQLVFSEARVDRARLDAGVAVDALVRVDVELFDLVVVRLVGPGWMQSTGQTSTQELSLVPTQGSAIT